MTLTALSVKEIIGAILILGFGLFVLAIGLSRRVATWWFKVLDKHKKNGNT
jgi:hypothetical protein